MKAEGSTQKKILDEVSTILREGGKTYELIPKIRKALSKDPCHQSKLQALKEEVEELYEEAKLAKELSHEKSEYYRLEKRSEEAYWRILNIITNLEDNG